MITAVFTDNSDYARATGLWQWDYGQRLRIEGLKLPTAVEIHFALTEFAGDAIPRVGTTKDGVTEVVIPDSFLENQTAGASTYEIYAWIYLADKTTGETIKRISMQVKCRPKPEGRDTPEDAEIFREAIEAVNASADRAEAAREGAEAAQKAAEEAAGKIEGEITGAGQIAEQVRQDAEAVAKDKQAVSQMVTETTQNAQKAASSAQAAERSGTAAKEAQTAAESAKAGAESAMKEVERDRTEVSETHRAVEQLRGAVDMDRQAVAADRRAVENTALQFGQFAQSAINAVGQAQEAAVGAVSAEGQRQTTAVQNAGTQAVSEVGTAKAEAVQAVTTEGDTQTKRVQDAAAGIVADREQIAANKAGVESLQQNKADAIVETAQGEIMTLTDSSDKQFRGLRVFGKSTQDGTPSVENPVPIVNAGEGGSITVEVTGRNLFKNSQHSAGFYTGDVGNTINSVMNAGYSWEADLSVLPGTELTLSVISPILSKFRFFVIDNNRTILLKHEDYSANSMDYTNTFTMPENGSRLCVSVIEVSAPEGVTIMLNIGNVAFSYEPCIEPQTLILATPNGLLGVPVSKDGDYVDSNGQQWVCDEVDLGRGKYVQRVAIEKNNGGWELNPSSDTKGRFFQYNKFTNIFLPALKKSLCNIASFTSWGAPVNDKYAFALNDNGIYFSPPKGVEITAEELNAKLNSLSFPVVVVGELATPIERDLTPEEIAAYSSLHTNYPTTVITNDAGAHMESSYVADTGTYIRNMEERLNAKLVNIQSALISQKISGGIKVTDSSRVPVVRFAMWGKTEQVVTTGAQLFDVADVERKVILNMNGTTSANGSVHTSGFVKVLPSTKYSVSKTRQNRGKFYDIDKRVLTTDKFDFELSNSGDKFVTSEQTEYVRFSIYETENLDNVMVNAGDTLKPWEPYSGGFPSPSPDYPQPIEITDQPVTITVKCGTEQQSITLTPPRPFTKWDKLEKVDGVWCWVYQHNTIMLGDVNYNVNSNHEKEGIVFSCTFEDASGGNQTSLCTRFINQDYIYGPNHKGKVGYCDHITLGTKYFRPPNREITTVSQFKEWLKVNPTELVYKTKESEPIPLSPSEQDKLNALTMYAPETEVTNTGGCNMELTYTVDTKSYVDSKIAAISAAVLEV